MKLIDLIEQISEFKSANFNELDKLELSELERYIRKIDNLRTAMEHRRDRLIKSPPVKDELFSVKEVAVKLKVTTVTIYNLLNNGKLESSKVGDSIRISQQQIDNYLNKK